MPTYRHRREPSREVTGSLGEAQGRLRSNEDDLEVRVQRGSRVDWVPVRHAPPSVGGSDDEVRAYGLD